MDDEHLQLIRAAKAGDIEAFTRLVRSYQDFLFRTAFAIVHDYSEAQDIVQEAFVKAFVSLRTLKDAKAFASWITTIATRIAIDSVRRRPKIDWYTDAVDTLTSPLVKSDLRIDLFNAMAQLTPEHRVIVVLREVQGFDYQEIANILNIPIGTVRSRLHTARMQLRDRLHHHVEKGESDGLP